MTEIKIIDQSTLQFRNVLFDLNLMKPIVDQMIPTVAGFLEFDIREADNLEKLYGISVCDYMDKHAPDIWSTVADKNEFANAAGRELALVMELRFDPAAYDAMRKQMADLVFQMEMDEYDDWYDDWRGNDDYEPDTRD